MRVLAVARNTFREAVRDKVLYVLLLFAAAAIFDSKALADQHRRDIKIAGIFRWRRCRCSGC